MSTTLQISSSQLNRAAGIRKRIESLEKQLSAILNANPTRSSRSANNVSRKKRGKMSAAARKKMSLAMKKRWAKAKSSGKNAL